MPRSWAERTAVAGILLLALWSCARADGTPAATGPKTILLLSSGLTWNDVRTHPRLKQVRALANAGGVALLNTAVIGERTPAAEFLTIGAGERIAAPDRVVTAHSDTGLPVSVPDLASAVYDNAAHEGAAARRVYRRRYGAWPPDAAARGLLLLGVPALRHLQDTTTRADRIGALGAALAATNQRTAAFGDWRAALVVTDRDGVVEFGSAHRGIGPTQIDRVLADEADVAALAEPNLTSLDKVAGAALAAVRSGTATRVLLIGAAPPPGQLGVVIAAGPGIAPGSVLVSPTTRTAGLIGSIDIAPTVLRWQGVADVTPGGSGRALRAVPVRSADAVVSTLARQVSATRQATVPVLVGYGTFAIGTALAAVIALAARRPGVARVARFGLLVAAGALVAFLPVGRLAPTHWPIYAALVAVGSVALALGAVLAGRAANVSALGLLLAFTAVVLIGDAFAGSPLVSRALLSGYYLPGIRFYGVGNEYMGLGIGAGLIGAALLPMPWPVTFALWALMLFGFGLPQFGSNSGSVIASTVVFGLGGIALFGGRIDARRVALVFVAAFVLVAGFAFLDRARPEDARSHAGAAIAAGQDRGPGALVEIAARKIAMNVGLAATPGTAAALAGLIPIWWLLSRGPLATPVTRALERRPRLRAVLPAGLWGALAALVFKDSGIVATLLLLAPVTAAVVDALLADQT